MDGRNLTVAWRQATRDSTNDTIISLAFFLPNPRTVKPRKNLLDANDPSYLGFYSETKKPFPRSSRYTERFLAWIK